MSLVDLLFQQSPRVIVILAHIVVESFAGFNFILRPEYTLASPSPAASSVIRQYGLLLLVVNGLLILLLLEHCRNLLLVMGLAETHNAHWAEQDSRIGEQLISRICGMLSLYHIAPLLRAVSKLGQRATTSGSKAFGRATIIANVHGILFAALFAAWYRF